MINMFSNRGITYNTHKTPNDIFALLLLVLITTRMARIKSEQGIKVKAEIEGINQDEDRKRGKKSRRTRGRFKVVVVPYRFGIVLVLYSRIYNEYSRISQEK